jgi:hypothetical protein
METTQPMQRGSSFCLVAPLYELNSNMPGKEVENEINPANCPTKSPALNPEPFL